MPRQKGGMHLDSALAHRELHASSEQNLLALQSCESIRIIGHWPNSVLHVTCRSSLSTLLEPPVYTQNDLGGFQKTDTNSNARHHGCLTRLRAAAWNGIQPGMELQPELHGIQGVHHNSRTIVPVVSTSKPQGKPRRPGTS